MRPTPMLAVLSAAALIAGCSDPAPDPVAPSPVPAITIAPADKPADLADADTRDGFRERLRLGRPRPSDVQFLLFDQSDWDQSAAPAFGPATVDAGGPLTVTGHWVAAGTALGTWEHTWTLSDGSQLVEQIAAYTDPASAAAAYDAWTASTRTARLPDLDDDPATVTVADTVGTGSAQRCTVQTTGVYAVFLYSATHVAGPSCDPQTAYTRGLVASGGARIVTLFAPYLTAP